MTLASRLTPVRVAGALALGGVTWLLSRSGLGDGAIALAAVTAVVAALWFPRAALLRFLWTVPLFVALLFASVQLMFHVPGDPFAGEKVASAEVMKQQHRLYGIPEKSEGGRDKSFAAATDFFGRYLGALVVDGEMGPSLKVQGRSVTDVLLPALPVSLCLGILAMILAVAIGLAFGVSAGLRPNSARDYGAMSFAILGVSLPSFVFGSLLILVFAVGKPFTWLPVAGWGSYAHLVLPSIALSLPYAAYIARLARAGTVEVMSQDFIRTARAKGLAEREVVWKHALRGALVPVVSFLGPAAAGIVTGSFVIETLFGLPGMGQWFVKGAVNRDYYVVLGTVILESGIVILLNLLVDLALPWIDPRLRGRA